MDQKVFHSVDKEALWNILRMYGIPHKIIHLIENLYKDSECTVLADGEPTAPFMVKTWGEIGMHSFADTLLYCIRLCQEISHSNFQWHSMDRKQHQTGRSRFC